ncbi:MAG: putative transposase [Desulforhopalus sp.]|jgi:putative transposase
MDETYIKVKGIWHYLYRAVDKEGDTVDFFLTRKRDKKAAKRFLIKAINNNGIPEKITIDGSAANKAAIEEFNSDNDTTIEARQVKYLNNVVEQDHRAIKRITNSVLGFKAFDSASITLNGIEMVHALRKGQLVTQNISVENLAKASTHWLHSKSENGGL